MSRPDLTLIDGGDGVDRQATRWFVRLRADDASEGDRRAWQQWLEASRDHRDAYAREEALWSSFGDFAASPEIGARIAEASRAPQAAPVRVRGARRRWPAAMAATLALLAVGTFAALRLAAPKEAAYQTAIGERRSVQLDDGSRIDLDAGTLKCALIDISTSDSAETAERMIDALLIEGAEAGLIRDAAVASSLAQQNAFWRLRESMSEAQKPEGGSIKHDVSVPVSRVPQFLRDADAAVMALMPDARIFSFGHLGDGNIHYNVSQPVGADKAAFVARWREVNAVVHAVVRAHGGSISAEHGVGQLKRDELIASRPAIETELMNRIKQAFDPAGIMNPGKMIALP